MQGRRNNQREAIALCVPERKRRKSRRQPGNTRSELRTHTAVMMQQHSNGSIDCAIVVLFALCFSLSADLIPFYQTSDSQLHRHTVDTPSAFQSACLIRRIAVWCAMFLASDYSPLDEEVVRGLLRWSLRRLVAAVEQASTTTAATSTGLDLLPPLPSALSPSTSPVPSAASTRFNRQLCNIRGPEFCDLTCRVLWIDADNDVAFVWDGTELQPDVTFPSVQPNSTLGVEMPRSQHQ
jgi:hypothetical protein